MAAVNVNVKIYTYKPRDVSTSPFIFNLMYIYT